MSTTIATRAKVLAEFAETIHENKGWCRWPKDTSIDKNDALDDPLHPDKIMPHLGTLLFLEESAMLSMFHQVGVLTPFLFSLGGASINN
jgi:hypothetical protein